MAHSWSAPTEHTVQYRTVHTVCAALATGRTTVQYSTIQYSKRDHVQYSCATARGSQGNTVQYTLYSTVSGGAARSRSEAEKARRAAYCAVAPEARTSSTVQYSAVITVEDSAMQHSAVRFRFLCGALWRRACHCCPCSNNVSRLQVTVPCRFVQHSMKSSRVEQSSTLYENNLMSNLKCSTVLYSTVQYSTVQYSTHASESF